MIIRSTIGEDKYVYYEKLFSSRTALAVNGVGLIRMTKKLFLNEVNGERHTYAVLGNRMVGISLETEEQDRIVLSKNTWYDWLFMLLPIGGIVGVMFGAIGGILSILFNLIAAITNGLLIRSGLKTTARVILSIALIVLANALWIILMIIIYGHLILAAINAI